MSDITIENVDTRVNCSNTVLHSGAKSQIVLVATQYYNANAEKSQLAELASSKRN